MNTALIKKLFIIPDKQIINIIKKLRKKKLLRKKSCKLRS